MAAFVEALVLLSACGYHANGPAASASRSSVMPPARMLLPDTAAAVGTPPPSTLVYALQCANVAAWSAVAFIFLPTLRSGESPFVPTAAEKLQALFGPSGVLQPGGGVIGPDDPPVAEQHLVDLGSGDGAVVRAASRIGGFGRCSGYETHPALVRIASLRSAGRSNEDFRATSLWDAPLADADVVTIYLLPRFLTDLAAKLDRELRDDALIVSNAYPLPELPTLRLVRTVPVQTSLSQDKSSALWVYRVCRNSGRADDVAHVTGPR